MQDLWAWPAWKRANIFIKKTFYLRSIPWLTDILFGKKLGDPVEVLGVTACDLTRNGKNFDRSGDDDNHFCNHAMLRSTLGISLGWILKALNLCQQSEQVMTLVLTERCMRHIQLIQLTLKSFLCKTLGWCHCRCHRATSIPGRRGWLRSRFKLIIIISMRVFGIPLS